MSSSWTERQGYIGDLQSKSKDELCDILLRQEKLLSNKRFIRSLPDKGRKISDFVQRVHLALAHHEEEEKRRHMLTSVRTEFQSKYQQALSQRQPGNHIDTPNVPLLETSQKSPQVAIPTSESVNQQDILLRAPHIGAADELHETVVSMKTVSDSSAGLFVVTNRTEEKYLVAALEKVTLTDDAVAPARSAAESSDRTGDNPSRREQPHKKPHYIEVLEKTELNAASRRPKFMPNQLTHRHDGSPTGSSSSSSLGQSPGGAPRLPADARRQRDRKHLDDITSAKLPPLHHSPAQLLSLEESFTLQQEHTRKQKELQAKMAAQKLTERLGVNMRSYSPEGGPAAGYREWPADGAQLSSDED